jgi:hypothetical protein
MGYSQSAKGFDMISFDPLNVGRIKYVFKNPNKRMQIQIKI